MSKGKTLLEYFYDFEKSKPNAVYLRQPKGDEWIEYTWAQVGDQARRMASAIKAMDLPPRTHIGITSKNCAHWIMADLAIMMSGHVSVPFYATLSGKQINQVLELSDTKVLFVGKLEVWDNMKTGIPDDVQCISFPHYEGNDKIEGFPKWEDLVAKHEPLKENYYPKLDDLFTIIYTSGTTGTPKGVMLTFNAVTALLDMEREVNNFRLFDSEDNRFFSYLPLNHIAERNVVEAASLFSGGTVSFAESLDTFAKNLGEASPTVFLAVPRIWKKFQLGILSKMPQSRLNLLLRLPVIKNVIKKKIRTGLGLNSANVLLTGAAPMPASLIEWFRKFDLNVREVYGMTENSGGCTLMPEKGGKPGTVGKPHAMCEVRIHEDTGEVLMRAPWNMTGYYKSEEKTKEVIDEEGWLHTGDKGMMTPDGYLKLTGRVKDTFKSAKGQYIVPGPIEFKFAKNDYIEQICVAGLGAPQPVAMIVLSEVGMAEDQSLISKNLEDTLAGINKELENYKRLGALVVIKDPWSVENGVLTPTLKIKRNVLDDKYLEDYTTWCTDKRKVIFED